MAKPAPRTPKPTVFVFTLGSDAKSGRKRVPAKYAATPCSLYRASEGARTKHLDALPEDPVTDADAEIVFGAIEALIDRRDLHRELSTDREIDAGKSPAYTTGFYPGVSFDDACEALARGGFTCIRVVGPLADPQGEAARLESKAGAFADLACHVDHASLADVLEATKKDEELGFHGVSAVDVVSRGFSEGSVGPFAAAVRGLGRALEPEARDILALVLALASRSATSSKVSDAIRAVLAELPAPSAPVVTAVRRLLDGPSGS